MEVSIPPILGDVLSTVRLQIPAVLVLGFTMMTGQQTKKTEFNRSKDNYNIYGYGNFRGSRVQKKLATYLGPSDKQTNKTNESSSPAGPNIEKTVKR